MSNRFQTALLGVITSWSAVSFAGGSLDLNLSNDAIRAAYDATQSNSGLHINTSVLHHMDDGDLIGVGVHAVDVRKGTEEAVIGVGAKVFGFVAEEVDGAAIGVGGFFRYNMPFNRDLSAAGYAYYAPSVVSFADTENMLISDWRAQFSVIPNARIYAGYRYNSIKLEDIDKRYKLANGFHLGMTLDF